MNPTLFYLLKVVLCAGALFGYYFLALRNRLFHQWNRFYLLAAVLFSLLFPIIPIPLFLLGERAADQLPIYPYLFTEGNEASVSATDSLAWNWPATFWVVYVGLGMVLLLRTFYGVYQIGRMLRRLPVQQIEQVNFVVTDHPQAPFSFFRWLFWKKDLSLESPGGQSVFRHELVHIQEKHSADKLFLEIVLAVFWVNPFFWLIRRELNMIHEFIADKKAVGNAGAEALAAMILQSVYGTGLSNLINPFFQKPIKRRLTMLQKTLKQPRNSYLGRVLVLPLCTLLLFAFSRATSNPKGAATLQPITVMIDAGHGGNDPGAKGHGLLEKDVALQLAKAIADENDNPNIRILFTRTGDEQVPLMQRLEETKHSGADLFLSIHAAVEVENGKGAASGFRVMVSGKNEASRKRSNLLGSALIHELAPVYPTTPRLLFPAAGVMVLDANQVPAVLLEFGFITNREDVAFVSQTKNQQLIARKILAAIASFAQQSSPTLGYKQDTIPLPLNPADIKNVQVNKTGAKRDSTTITITLKNGETQTFTESEARKKGILPTPVKTDKAGSRPLIVVDGNISATQGATVDKLDVQFPAETVESINVLSGPSAVKKYGSRAADGAIEIALKKEKTTKPAGSDMLGEPLVIVDGEERGYMGKNKKLEEVLNLRGEDIESMNVLKGEHATKIYGDKGKHGVIEITTKNGKDSKNTPPEPASLVPRQGPDIVHGTVDKVPHFPGGELAWQAFLQKNLNPAAPVAHGAPAGKYTVQVQFKVANDGTISGVQPVTQLGYGMENEVLALMQKSPKWAPAEINGYKVSTLHQQKVTFVIAAE